MTLHENALAYLLRFLTGLDDEAILRTFRIGYTADEDKFGHYDLVFIPSGFFEAENYGKAASIPQSIQEINGIPFLYGRPEVEKRGDTVLVHADLPASAFFFLSRYEEICRREVRDIHGRFPGKQSLAYRHNLLSRPLVDEYGLLIRQWLRSAGKDIPEPEPKVGKVWVTHDLDQPFFCKSLRSVARETIHGKGLLYALKVFFGKIDDPYDTFSWMFQAEEEHLKKMPYPCQTIYFIKAGGVHVYDKPHYRLRRKRIRRLLQEIASHKVLLGLHGSYSAAEIGASLLEKKQLELFAKRRLGIGRNKIFLFRSHYLRSREPEDFRKLEKIGITDDFTMGYADVAGFRLGTSRPVVWIDPARGTLSKLVLHPLTVMDSTLYQKEYMYLNEDAAKEYCAGLFEKTRRFGGDICLLWHNTTLTGSAYPGAAVPWARSFYLYVLDYLANMESPDTISEESTISSLL
ncbi:MAG: polysaccharide deacetylase family protein [Bacteroides sp.]|nr:polysaccharide deacetylase family protein [Ruminococcus flavefaciens]MCM1555548.1 polysaccharide deacetylase family protein [Bacteroides sp.]